MPRLENYILNVVRSDKAHGFAFLCLFLPLKPAPPGAHPSALGSVASLRQQPGAAGRLCCTVWSSETQKEALAGQGYLNNVESVHLITNGAFVRPLPTAFKLF